LVYTKNILSKTNNHGIINHLDSGVIFLHVNYDKLWKLLIDKKMTKTQLKDAAGVSTNAIANMGKGEKVSMETLAKICEVLDCDIGDVMSFRVNQE